MPTPVTRGQLLIYGALFARRDDGHRQRAALHRNSIYGGTRLLLDTEGVADVPVRGFGATTRTNRFGKAVVADVSSYYRSKASIDLNTLPDNADATQSVVQATLTEGAIGYRRFNVISGQRRWR